MNMIETTSILNNQAVKMRLMGKNFYGSPFVYKALCVIFTCDQELTSVISILNARLGRMNGTAAGVALKEQSSRTSTRESKLSRCPFRKTETLERIQWEGRRG